MPPRGSSVGFEPARGRKNQNHALIIVVSSDQPTQNSFFLDADLRVLDAWASPASRLVFAACLVTTATDRFKVAVFGLVELGGRSAVGECLFRDDGLFHRLGDLAGPQPWSSASRSRH